jgi:hypothetical protein
LTQLETTLWCSRAEAEPGGGWGGPRPPPKKWEITSIPLKLFKIINIYFCIYWCTQIITKFKWWSIGWCSCRSWAGRKFDSHSTCFSTFCSCSFYFKKVYFNTHSSNSHLQNQYVVLNHYNNNRRTIYFYFFFSKKLKGVKFNLFND